MTNKEVIKKLIELKETANEIDISTDTIIDKIDDIIYGMGGAKDEHDIDDDPFAVDDELDSFLDKNKFDYKPSDTF